MRNKEKQEFLVPVSQWMRQWRGQEMLAGSTNEVKTSNPVVPNSEIDPQLVVLTDEVPSKLFKPKLAISGWGVFWLALIAIMSSTSIAGYWLLTSPPSTADCRQGHLAMSAGEKLYCAQKRAESGKLKDLQVGMAIATSFPADHPLYNEAQRIVGDLSLDLVRLAQQKVDSGDLKAAKAIVKRIPRTSVSYQEVIRKTKRWDRQWEYGKSIEKEFESAVKVQNWQKARGNAEKLYDASSEYWRDRGRERLLVKLAAEKEGWQLLRDARKLARYGDLSDISAAIALTNRIKPKTNARSLAKTEMNQWSQTILKAVAAKYQQQDFAKAIALAKLVPKDVAVAGLAKDWIAMSQASQKAQSKQDTDISKALAMLGQIRPQSPLYKQAQAKMATWKRQMQG